jgi:pimeloyl-ACP methyl ester carboxylesterase
VEDQMKATTVDTLRVPGASLYYKVRGSGPVLLMIAGGAGDAESFNLVADHLIDHYTVVTYDRRGLSRSPPDDPDQRIEIETHSDDVHRLLAALGTAPACVLGNSIGALIGLDLALHHPEQVRILVAHEPPVGQLLSEAERPHEDSQEIYRREGGAAAMRKFAASIGVNFDAREPGVELPQENTRSAKNREFFFRHDRGAVGRYRLDIAALRAAPTRIVLAGGEAGRDYFPYLCAARLAERLGTTVVEFPGHHAGYVSHPRAFAERLREVLGA